MSVATGALSFLLGPRDPTHCFCGVLGVQGKSSQIFLLWTAWHNFGAGVGGNLTEPPGFSLCGTTLHHAESWGLSHCLFLYLPVLTLNLSWDCSYFVKKNDFVGCRFPISIQFELFQGFLITYVHLEDPFWFFSIAIDLFLNNVLCVISRSLEWEWWVCWAHSYDPVSTGTLWKHCVQSRPAPSSIKILLGLHGDWVRRIDYIKQNLHPDNNDFSNTWTNISFFSYIFFIEWYTSVHTDLRHLLLFIPR